MIRRCSILVGTPKGRLTRMEKEFVEKSRQQAREGVEVKILPQDQVGAHIVDTNAANFPYRFYRARTR